MTPERIKSLFGEKKEDPHKVALKNLGKQLDNKILLSSKIDQIDNALRQLVETSPHKPDESHIKIPINGNTRGVLDNFFERVPKKSVYIENDVLVVRVGGEYE